MRYAVVLLVFFSTASFAAGWTNMATPTRIDVERGNGFMVYGSFGNAGTCTVVDRFYVQISHPQYKEIYSAVLAAFTAGKKVQAYIDGCNPVTWYSAASTTFNTLGPSSVLNLAN